MSRFIEFSNGVKLSEETVIDACKRQGIVMVPPKPKHIFEPGDVAYLEGHKNRFDWRLIIAELKSVNQYGVIQGNGTQKYFENNGYKFAGKQSDLLK